MAIESKPRCIIHLDLDAFFCAVEEQLDPGLQGKAFAVGGEPDKRGVVASCSYPARKFGIRSAMPMARAVRLLPTLIILPGHYSEYIKASKSVMGEISDITANVEQISIDEAYLDITDLERPSLVLARQLQSTIRHQIGLPCSLGIATNKLVAKVATDVGKAAAHSEGPPNAIQLVPPGREAEFLAPLPVESLPGVGPKTAAILENLDIYTINDLANKSESDLVEKFGKLGHYLHRCSHGIDDSPVETRHETKSISREVTFSKDLRDFHELRDTLHELSESVATRIQRKHLGGTTVRIKVRWADFSTLTRQITLDHPCNRADEIFEAGLQLFRQTWKKGKSVRLLGIGVSGLETPYQQLRLWVDQQEVQRTEREKQLQAALELLHQRFGDQILHWGESQMEDHA
jgi:DNA polymerase-4